MISTEAFQSHHVPEAARLFAAQYARLRNDNELLPAQFAEAAVLEPRLLGILREHPGVVALEGDCVVGYLVGFTGIPQFKGLANGGYVPVWGLGLAESQEVETVFPALYAELSAEWMRHNCPSMAVSYLLPGGALQKTLFGLGFGQLLYDGMRSLSRIALLADGDIEVREAEEGDLAELAALERGLAGTCAAHRSSCTSMKRVQKPCRRNSWVKVWAPSSPAKTAGPSQPYTADSIWGRAAICSMWQGRWASTSRLRTRRPGSGAWRRVY